MLQGLVKKPWSPGTGTRYFFGLRKFHGMKKVEKHYYSS